MRIGLIDVDNTRFNLALGKLSAYHKAQGDFVEWVYPYLFRDDFANRKTEILGNVFDNPELIPNQSTAI